MAGRAAQPMPGHPRPEPQPTAGDAAPHVDAATEVLTRAKQLSEELAAARAELRRVADDATRLAAESRALRAAQAEQDAADGRKQCPWCGLDADNPYCARTGQLHVSADAAKARVDLMKAEYGYNPKVPYPMVKNVLQLLAYRDVLKLPLSVVTAAQQFFNERQDPTIAPRALQDWLPPQYQYEPQVGPGL